MPEYRLLGSGVRNQTHKTSKRTKPIKHIVLHTAEMVPDTKPPYTSAQRLSEYGASTSRNASWHCQVDSGGVVWQLPEDLVANHSVGNNSTSLGIEMCMRATDWTEEPWDPWKQQLFDNLVEQVTTWVQKYEIPVERPHVLFKKTFKGRNIADNQHLPKGIYAHADLDPSRRHDPGQDFPWDKFLEEVNLQLAVRVTKQVRKEMATRKESLMPVPYLKTEDIDFLETFIRELEEFKARPTSLVYVLRFYREIAQQLGLPGNKPEKIAGKLLGQATEDEFSA